MEKREGAFQGIFLGIFPAIVAVAFWAAEPAGLEAQPLGIAVAAPAAADDDSGPGNFAAPDRMVLQALNRAKKLLDDHHYGEALDNLSQILRGNEDYFYQPDKKIPIYKGLKAEAVQLLGQMPREGLDLYEARSGAEARDKLNKAVAAGDDKALSEVSARYFHTQAGYEATYLLALYDMDHGAPLAGALTLKRLREAGPVAEGFEPGLSLTQAACFYQAGMTADCQQVLADLKRRLGKPALQISGRDVPWFEKDSEASAWLAKLTELERMAGAAETDRWAMFRGDPTRNASTVGSAPLLNLRWRVEVADDPFLDKSLLQQEAQYREQGVALFSGLHPLAVGDKILMRTANNLVALDFTTGKRVWQTPAEEDTGEPRSNRFTGFVARNNGMNQPSQQYGQRIWDDAAYGTMSSDGKLAFVIEELPLGVMGQQNMGFVMVGPGRTDPSNQSVTNCLAAYDINGDGKPGDGGKLIWQLGGRDSLRQNDTFFLGPPLPLRGQLYVMAEIKDEMRLLALDAATGNLLWSQQLAMVESNITQDPVRRLAGVSPSYSDGVLICPTGAGCVVAVDLATRSLLWGCIYPPPHGSEQPAQGRRFRGMGMNQIQAQFANGNGVVPRWLDGTAVIANGRVLVTPAEADGLYCLNLADGKPAWPAQERGEHAYIGCVHNGIVVLVGRNGIDAIKLDDGSRAWDTISVPTGAGVCGHGYFSEGKYFVPLSSGEVMSINVAKGKIVGTSKPRRSGVPGNLVCYRGRVISQGLDGLELYYQSDAARDEVSRLLAANPDDVEGLTLRGEMLLDEGKSAEAVTDFRRAYGLDKKSDTHGRTRELLRDALLAGLRDDFPAHRKMASEVEPLLDDPAQRATYYRYMAAGLQRGGDWKPAVDFLLKLVDLVDGKPSLDKVDRSHLARTDCWVRAHLATLRNAGGAPAAKVIDAALEQRLDEAKLDTGVDGLKQFLAFFGSQPAAEAARSELRDRLVQAGRIMEAELLVQSTADPADRKAQAASLADMAGLNLRAKRVSDAAACFRELHQRFADVPCHGNLTGDQWLAIFPDGDALRKEFRRPESPWPVGEVQAQPVGVGSAVYRANRFDMVIGGPSGPFFTDYTLSWGNGQPEICLRDGDGRLLPPVRLVDTGGRMFAGMYNQNPTLARTCGHLLIVALGTKICALDPWKASGNNGSQVLWTVDLTDSTADNAAGMMGGVVFVNNNGMDRDFRANPFGPVNARYVCFQRRRNIVAADPLTGDTLWVRQDIPQGSEVFGDEDYVLMLPPGSSEATVYRASDGELIGTRKVSRPSPGRNYYPGNELAGNALLSNQGYDFVGRNVLTWQEGGDSNGRVLGLFDPIGQKAVWPSRTFASGARVSVVQNEAVGVLEPGGHFVLIALADGRTIADLKLDAREHFPVTDLVVTRMGDQYIVLAHDNRVLNNSNEDNMVQQPQGIVCYPIRKARIYAIDLQGKPAWPAPTDVDHQMFLLSQPTRLPVLVFAVFHSEQRANQWTMRTSLVAVDRRDGRIVYDNPDLKGQMRSMAVDIHGDPADKTVRISANNDTVSLLFTDKPINAKDVVRHSTGVKKPSGKLGEALLDAVQKASGVPK